MVLELLDVPGRDKFALDPIERRVYVRDQRAPEWSPLRIRLPFNELDVGVVDGAPTDLDRLYLDALGAELHDCHDEEEVA